MGPHRSRIVNGVYIIVRRTTSTRISAGGLRDTYDLYDVRFGFGEWFSVRRVLDSQSCRTDVKQAIENMCLDIYQELL